MSRTKKNSELVEIIFKPNAKTGLSEWKTREEIDKTGLKLGKNGNIRQNTPWTNKYLWEVKRKNDNELGKPISFRTIGFDKSKDEKSRPIKKEIKESLLKKYSNCLHCGNHRNLCIDHKNDMYNDSKVLNAKTQEENDFQVLCNKCNKDLKHQANHKEKKTGKIYSVKNLNLINLKYDKFDYPWEKCLTKYDEKIVECKMYSYWYDIEEFYRKRDIFVTITLNINSYIKKKVELVI